MRTTIKSLIVYVTLASYALVGLAGHTASLDEIVNIFNGMLQVSAENGSNKVKHRPVWTKKRHIPPTVQSKTVFHPHIISRIAPVDDKPARCTQYDFIASFDRSNTHSDKPRDPPNS
jgi:hypothetical protein